MHKVCHMVLTFTIYFQTIILRMFFFNHNFTIVEHRYYEGSSVVGYAVVVSLPNNKKYMYISILIS